MGFGCQKFPLCRIGIRSDENAISELALLCDEPETVPDDPLIATAFRELEEYFAGTRHEFDLPLNPQGTPFQQRVWRALRRIPYGGTASYKEIAEAVGSPGGCRAVGMANHCNPIAILIPCHRVIGANGKLVGYAGGLDLKRKLLELETGMESLF
ncbi:methylated-DNA--[protein]-cysteine S-methyltransferase [uncultured Victivallis sp.]|uniref:methylated-DNA--[protein]-cysteine S-methyltransferase n=1 Tax=uncultured Victivallis sp. TaxID=354118 RepID=UPI0025E8839F|nr:methylated-DNA--[protein]-cysteine S-methyltransferase [uncultured Victivallis sp.]